MDSESYKKIVLVGDSGVGKSSLVHWFIYRSFSPSQPTIGSAANSKVVKVGRAKSMRLNIWDTAGQERFRSLARLYYRGSAGCLCVFDVSCLESFSNLAYWIDNYKQHNYINGHILLVANKCDKSNWAVTEDEINSFARKNGLEVIYTNCVQGYNVDKAFDLLVKSIVDYTYEEDGIPLIATNFSSCRC